jgi:hypothetical protein
MLFGEIQKKTGIPVRELFPRSITHKAKIGIVLSEFLVCISQKIGGLAPRIQQGAALKTVLIDEFDRNGRGTHG